VLAVINDQLLPWMRELGYPLSETDYAIWNDNEQMSPKDRLEIFKGIKELGYKVKKEQIETELDVEIVGEITPNVSFAQNKPENRRNFNLPHNHTHSGCGAGQVAFNPAGARDLTPEEEDFLKKLYENPESVKWSYSEFKASHSPLLDAVKRGFGTTSFDFDSTDHRRMRAWLDNIHRFGVDKTQAEIYELNELLKDSKDFNEFRNKAKAVFPKYKDYHLE